MRKKTIKFYFFNSALKNPSMNYLFCFSKRAFKQNRQLIKLRSKLNNLKNRKKRFELISYIKQYKNTIRYKINLNQWLFNCNTLQFFFLKSFFNKSKVLNLLKISKFLKKKQLTLWFFLKNRFYRHLRFFLKKYTKTGILSSHFVHILSRKNLTYQTRSKYRSKVFNMNNTNKYVYKSARQMHLYTRTLHSLLYFFTSNHTQKHLWINDDYNLQTSAWVDRTSNVNTVVNRQFIINSTKFLKFPINTTNLTGNVCNEIYTNKNLIINFLEEADKQKKDNLWSELTNILTPTAIEHIHGAKFFLNHSGDNLMYAYMKYVSMYLYIFKSNIKYIK